MTLCNVQCVGAQLFRVHFTPSYQLSVDIQLTLNCARVIFGRHRFDQRLFRVVSQVTGLSFEEAERMT